MANMLAKIFSVSLMILIFSVSLIISEIQVKTINDFGFNSISKHLRSHYS